MSESLNGASGSSPAIAEGAVYFTGTDNFFYVLDAETGEGRWKFKIEGSVASPPVIVDGVVYFGSNNGYLYALE